MKLIKRIHAYLTWLEDIRIKCMMFSGRGY